MSRLLSLTISLTIFSSTFFTADLHADASLAGLLAEADVLTRSHHLMRGGCATTFGKANSSRASILPPLFQLDLDTADLQVWKKFVNYAAHYGLEGSIFSPEFFRQFSQLDAKSKQLLLAKIAAKYPESVGMRNYDDAVNSHLSPKRVVDILVSSIVDPYDHFSKHLGLKKYSQTVRYPSKNPVQVYDDYLKKMQETLYASTKPYGSSDVMTVATFLRNALQWHRSVIGEVDQYVRHYATYKLSGSQGVEPSWERASMLVNNVSDEVNYVKNLFKAVRSIAEQWDSAKLSAYLKTVPYDRIKMPPQKILMVGSFPNGRASINDLNTNNGRNSDINIAAANPPADYLRFSLADGITFLNTLSREVDGNIAQLPISRVPFTPRYHSFFNDGQEDGRMFYFTSPMALLITAAGIELIIYSVNEPHLEPLRLKLDSSVQPNSYSPKHPFIEDMLKRTVQFQASHL